MYISYVLAEQNIAHQIGGVAH